VPIYVTTETAPLQPTGRSGNYSTTPVLFYRVKFEEFRWIFDTPITTVRLEGPKSLKK